MDYIGSKAKLLDWMFGHISRHLAELGIDPKTSTFMDACAGSGAVSIYAAEYGFQEIVATDLLSFPAHIIHGKLGLDVSRNDEANEHIRRMNNLDPLHGFFSEHYSSEDTEDTEDPEKRLYFTLKNGHCIDACRAYIDTVTDPVMRSFLLCCLLEALSRVCNTAGVHGAFLKKFKERAREEFTVKNESISEAHPKCRVFNQDILTLLENRSEDIQEDVLYIDPPYTERQYAPNYHLYETLVLADDPQIRGKTGLRDWESAKSTFCSKSDIEDFFWRVLKASKAKLVVVSYSSDGLLSLGELESLLMDALRVDVVEVQSRLQKRFKADNSRQNRQDTLREYLLFAPRPDPDVVWDLWDG